jgi:hypothetical protein
MYYGIAITISSIYSAHRIRVATNCDRRAISVVIRGENGWGSIQSQIAPDGPRSPEIALDAGVGGFANGSIALSYMTRRSSGDRKFFVDVGD